MTLTSHGDLHLGMVIMGLDLQGMQDAVSLATPTIPPMTRSPVRLLPLVNMSRVITFIYFMSGEYIMDYFVAYGKVNTYLYLFSILTCCLTL